MITTHGDVSKAQNSVITVLKWCDLGINRTIFSQSDCSNEYNKSLNQSLYIQRNPVKVDCTVAAQDMN